MIGSAKLTAIRDCNIEAIKFSPITQLSNQFAVYGSCIVLNAIAAWRTRC